MNDIPTYYTELIIKYLSGEATPEEIGRLEEWVKESPARREEFIALKKTAMLLEKARLERSADPEQEWRMLKERIRPAVSARNTQTAFPFRWLLRAAAALILLGGRGNISVTANIAPRQMSELCKAAIAGDVPKVRQLNSLLGPLNKLLFVEGNPIPVKWALEQMGKIGRGIRLPLTPLSAGCQDSVRTALSAAGLL